jgi:hypothetical protein
MKDYNTEKTANKWMLGKYTLPETEGENRLIVMCRVFQKTIADMRTIVNACIIDTLIIAP